MSYIQNTPFATSTIFLNTKNADSRTPYRFNLTNKIKCPLNASFILSVQDLTVPNILNNITETNNIISFETQTPAEVLFYNFAGVGIGSISNYQAYLAANGWGWNVNALWTTQTYNGLQYASPYRSGGDLGKIQKTLPDYHGTLEVIVANPYPAGAVYILIDGVAVLGLAPNEPPYTYTQTFTPGQVLIIQEQGSVAVMSVLSVKITQTIAPFVDTSQIEFPINYYTARTFRDYFNTQYPIQYPNLPLITCVYDNYKYSFVSTKSISLVNIPKKKIFINFDACASDIIGYNTFLDNNAFGNLYPRPNSFVGTSNGYPIVNYTLGATNLTYVFTDNGQANIRFGRGDITLAGVMDIYLNDEIIYINLNAVDDLFNFTFVEGDVLRISEGRQGALGGLIMYSLEVLYDGLEEVNACSKLIGVSKNRTNKYIYPVVSSNPLYTIDMPGMINFSGSPFFFMKIDNITLSNLNSTGMEDNTLIRIPVNAMRGQMIFHRPTEQVKFIINRKHFDYIELDLLDDDNNHIKLEGADFQLNLRLDYFYVPEMKSLREGTISHSLEIQKIEPTKE